MHCFRNNAFWMKCSVDPRLWSWLYKEHIIVIKMKLEFVDIAVALVALSMLGGFAILQNPVFLYVFAVLVAAEIIGIFIGRKKTEN